MKIVLLASAAALMATAAVAAPQAPAAPAPAAVADTSGVSDQDVQKVAMVGAAVQKLTAETKDPDALSNQEAALLKNLAITFEQYNEVANKAQANPALAARLSKAKPTDSALNDTVEKAKKDVAGPAAPNAAAAAAPTSATAVDASNGKAAPPAGVSDAK